MINLDEKMGTRRGIPLPRRVTFLSKREFFANICEEPKERVVLSRRPGRLSHFFRPEVRARKPNLLGLRGIERELWCPPGWLFQKSRPEVRARKPKTMGLRGIEREL
nr:hypothetical protein [uncultured Mogibacterium sp.]